MTRIDLKTHSLHYRVDGERGPWLMFCNSLGTDLHMWDPQADRLSRDFRVLRYDRRGHGLSSAPPAPFSMADLGADVLALLDALSIARTHFCGLSIGGQVGLWLGVNAAQRLDKLVLCATAAKIGTADSWNARIAQVQAAGLAPLREATAERWFTPAFQASNPSVVDRVLDSFGATSPDAYNGCCAALAASDFRVQLGQIRVPVLAISGDDDPVCPPADLQAIAEGASDGRHQSLPGRHIVNLESPEACTDALQRFLAD